MADLSTQNPCGLAQRIATALLRAGGGTTASLQMPPLQGDSTDAGQIGLNAPGFLSLQLFLIEAISASENQGQAYLYRLLLQEASGEWPM